MAQVKENKKIHRLDVSIQLTGDDEFACTYDIVATAQGKKLYGASGISGEPFDVLVQVLVEMKRAYPNQAFFTLFTEGEHKLVPKPNT